MLQLLAQLFLPPQVGFVPQRSVFTALDIFTAVRMEATTDSDLNGAIVMLLDSAIFTASGDV